MKIINQEEEKEKYFPIKHPGKNRGFQKIQTVTHFSFHLKGRLLKDKGRC